MVFEQLQPMSKGVRIMSDVSNSKAFADRLAQLRIKAGVSSRDMSLSLEQNDSYINKIENQKALPSMKSFFEICRFLKITPAEFFQNDVESPAQVKRLMSYAAKLSEYELDHILNVMTDIARLKEDGKG